MQRIHFQLFSKKFNSITGRWHHNSSVRISGKWQWVVKTDQEPEQNPMDKMCNQHS
jgi:hypothetical protein